MNDIVMCVIDIMILLDATHPIITPLQLTTVTSYFDMRKSILKEYEDKDILKTELMAEAPPWDPSSPEFSRQEQSMIDYKRCFVIPTTSEREQVSINSAT